MSNSGLLLSDFNSFKFKVGVDAPASGECSHFLRKDSNLPSINLVVNEYLSTFLFQIRYSSFLLYELTP